MHAAHVQADDGHKMWGHRPFSRHLPGTALRHANCRHRQAHEQAGKDMRFMSMICCSSFTTTRTPNFSALQCLSARQAGDCQHLQQIHMHQVTRCVCYRADSLGWQAMLTCGRLSQQRMAGMTKPGWPSRQAHMTARCYHQAGQASPV